MTPFAPPGGTRATVPYSARRGTLSPWVVDNDADLSTTAATLRIYSSEAHACPDGHKRKALDYRACAAFHSLRGPG